MTQYRKRPEVVTAEQFHFDMEQWPEGVVPDTAPCLAGDTAWLEPINHFLSDRDWIITHDDGSKSVCKEADFAEEWERVGEESG